MKLSRYKQFIGEGVKFWNNLDDDDLRERLSSLIKEREDIDDQIQYIRSILRQREEDSIEKKAKDFPERIWDLNKEQLSLILEHSNKTTTKQYDISQKYLKQLSGVMDCGFNTQTNQFYFNIVTSHSMSESDKFVLNPEIVKSIKFLGENLSKMEEGYVLFGILYRFNDHGYNEKVHYYSDKEIDVVFSTYDIRKVKSIEEMLKIIVESDISNKNNNW
jgi:hypothetical protein